MTPETQLIIWGVGVLLTSLSVIFSLFKYIINVFKERIDFITNKFDMNTDKVMNKFDVIVSNINNGFKENLEDHTSIKIKVIELATIVNDHIGGKNGKSQIHLE